jgi:hypothetical protein
VAGAKAYDLQIAADSRFESVVVSERVSQARFVWQGAPASRHFWRVRAVDSGGTPGDWSAGQAIGVVEDAAAAISPADGTRVSPPRRRVVALGAARPLEPGADAVVDGGEPAAPVTLRWSPLSAAVRFRVQVRKDGQVVFDGNARVPRATWAPAEPGRYEWVVRGVDAQDEEGPWSVPSSFRVGLAAARLVSPAPGALPEPDSGESVRFLWEPVRGAARYAVELATDGEFAKLTARHEAERPELAIAPPAAGTYHWRVVARDASGDLVSRSEGRVLDVKARGRDVPRAVVRAPARPPPRGGAPVLRDESSLRTGGQIGWSANLASISSPFFGADVTSATPWLARRWMLSARAGTYAASATVPAQGALSEPVDTHVRLIPVSLVAIFEQPLGRLRLYGGAGPAVQIALVRVDLERRTHIALGAEGIAGVTVRAGPGDLFAELHVPVGSIDAPEARLRTTGVILGGGYRYTP